MDPSVDTLPTLLELLGIPIPSAVQGKSFLPLLEGKDEPIRRHIYYEILKELEGEERFPVSDAGFALKNGFMSALRWVLRRFLT